MNQTVTACMQMEEKCARSNSDSKTPAILNIMTKTEQSLYPGFSLFSLLPLGLEAREPSLSSSRNDVLGWLGAVLI